MYNVERKNFFLFLTYCTQDYIWGDTLHLTFYSSVNPERDSAQQRSVAFLSMHTEPLFAYIV